MLSGGLGLALVALRTFTPDLLNPTTTKAVMSQN